MDSWNDEEPKQPPLSVFGIPLKAIIVVLVMMVILLFVSQKKEIEGLFDYLTNLASDQRVGDMNKENREIVATPEMISKAAAELQAEKIKSQEMGESTSPDDRFYYIIELESGGDLEGTDLEITPDSVSIVSARGTKTVIPRTSVKSVKRVKLPPARK